MYGARICIRDCGYGRSKRCRRRVWPVAGLLTLALGLGGVTAQALIGQPRTAYAADGYMGIEEMPVAQGDAMLTVSGALASGMVSGIGSLPDPAADSGKPERVVPLVVIDPGHGGGDEGCARAGVEEKEINLQIGLALRDRLLQMGYEVLMTREEDTEISLEERVAIANEAGADAYVSIHQNAWEDSGVSGIETWYNVSGENRDSRRLARLVHGNVLSASGEKDRALHEDETLYVIRETDMSSCLVETGFLSNAKDRDALCDPQYQGKIADGIADGIDLYFHPKTMYLTFDDGPSAENTCAILDILKERDIQATFFVVGENVRKNPDVARRIVEEGHTIGIHCDSHDYGEIYRDVDSYLADFEEAYQTVYEVTGVRAKLFRFPGGSINSHNRRVYEDIIEEMTDRGFIYFDWNASLEDAVSKSDPDTLLRNARETTLGRKKVVMLAHDVVYNTTLCLEDVIDSFPEYEMLPLTEEVEPVQF